jgi:hypothetical protein
MPTNQVQSFAKQGLPNYEEYLQKEYSAIQELLTNPSGNVFSPQHVRAGTVLAFNPQSGPITNYVDAETGRLKDSAIATDPATMTKENIALVVALEGGSRKIIYKDGTSSYLEPGYVEWGTVGGIHNGTAEETHYFMADGSDYVRPDDESSGNFFSKLAHEGTDAFGDQTMRVLIPVAAIAVMVYSGYLVGVGALAGAAGAEAGAGAGGIAAGEAGAGAGGIAAGEAGAGAGEMATYGMGGSGLSGSGASSSWLGSLGASDLLNVPISPIINQLGSGGSDVATTTATGTVTATDVASGTVKAGSTISAAEAAKTGLSTAELLKIGVTVLPLVGSVANALGGGNSGQTLSATSTTDTRPEYIKQSAEKTWNDYIDDFYGTSADAKSAKVRAEEDAAYKKAADEKLLAGTTAAMSPYQQQLTSTLNQAATGTGYYKPVSFGFGGKQMTSFVPKTNLNLANQTLGVGKESSSIGAGLAEMENKLALGNMPNAAADTYSAKLAELMKFANTGGSTNTQTGTTPGTNTWATILNALNTSANIYSKLYPWQKAATTAAETDYSYLNGLNPGE